jgi:hypothetical protein
MSGHIQRIEKIEKEIQDFALKKETRKDIESLRSEFKKLYDGNHLELLELKAHLLGVEQDVSGRLSLRNMDVDVTPSV